jgi:hypothetical protein
MLKRTRTAGRTARLPCRNRVTISANNLAPLLLQALGTPNTTVIVADGVELNLSPYLGGPISIKAGVQLIASIMTASPSSRAIPIPPYVPIVSARWSRFRY